MRILLPCDYFMLIISFGSFMKINSQPDPGPGTIYYRKPTNLVYYKKYPPVLIYPKKEDFEFEKFHHIDQSNYKPDVKYFMVNPHFLQHIMLYDDKYYVKKVEKPAKKPEYEKWISWLFGIKNKELPENHIHTYETLNPDSSYVHFADTTKYQPPVYLYQPYKPLNIVPPQFQKHYYQPHLQFQGNSDIKPVVEHIEGDIKYDFRTKTHSYDR